MNFTTKETYLLAVSYTHLSALDEETRGQISKIIRYLASEGIAIIIVTHDNAFVDEIAQRIITMKDGKITIQ